MRIIHLWHSSWNHSPNFEWSLSVLTGKGWIHDYQMHIWISSWSSYTQPQCKSSASSVSKIRKIVKLADLLFKSFVGQLQRREKGFSLRSRMLYIIKVWNRNMDYLMIGKKANEIIYHGYCRGKLHRTRRKQKRISFLAEMPPEVISKDLSVNSSSRHGKPWSGLERPVSLMLWQRYWMEKLSTKG